MLLTTGRIGRIALYVASRWMMIPALCQVEARAGSEHDAGFQVVTIKRGDPHPDGSFTSRLANTNVYTTKNAPLSFVILQAYPWRSVFDPTRLKGAPDWVTTDAYDIQAKLEDATAEAWKKISTAEQADRIAPLLR